MIWILLALALNPIIGAIVIAAIDTDFRIQQWGSRSALCWLSALELWPVVAYFRWRRPMAFW